MWVVDGMRVLEGCRCFACLLSCLLLAWMLPWMDACWPGGLQNSGCGWTLGLAGGSSIGSHAPISPISMPPSPTLILSISPLVAFLFPCSSQARRKVLLFHGSDQQAVLIFLLLPFSSLPLPLYST